MKYPAFYRTTPVKDHFALDTKADEIAALVGAFVTSSRAELQARRAS